VKTPTIRQKADAEWETNQIQALQNRYELPTTN